mgnify:CR=1 FL=1
MSKPKVKPGVTVKKRQTRARPVPASRRVRTATKRTTHTTVSGPRKPLGYRVQNKDISPTNRFYGNLNVKNRTIHSLGGPRGTVGTINVRKGHMKGAYKHRSPDSQNRQTLMGVRKKLGLNLMDSIPAVTVELKGVDVRVGEKKVPIGVKIKPKPAPFPFWIHTTKWS